MDLTGNPQRTDSSSQYEITVIGILHESWTDWLGGMQITVCDEEDGTAITILRGLVLDQAELRAVLNRLWDLNATIVTVKKTGQPEQKNL